MSIETETLRDKFAMAALTGMLASEDQEFEMSRMYYPAQAAGRAYEMADAMLAERAKSQPQPEGRAALTAKWGG
jgi:hypothetical protein